jgi:branched-subunit amino acid ABC-type transport system permease component
VANYTGSWWLTLLTAPACLAVIGYLIERFLLRRLYGQEELLQIILTFGLVLIIEDVVEMLWGSMSYALRDISGVLQGALEMGG